MGGTFDIPGAVILKAPPPTNTTKEWCDYWGVEVKRGWATVYKAVNDELRSGYDCLYPIGKTVKCADWKEGHSECGYGLHFCADPEISHGYFDGATRFLECKIKVANSVVVNPGAFSDKIKAPAAKVVREVTRNRQPVEEPTP